MAMQHGKPARRESLGVRTNAERRDGGIPPASNLQVMALFDVGGVFLIALLVLWFWAIYDVITSESASIRNLPKVLWVIVVVLLPILAIGPILWIVAGRPVRRSSAARHAAPRRTRRPADVAPEVPTASLPIVTDRRSAELDRMLDEWERSRRDEGATES